MLPMHILFGLRSEDLHGFDDFDDPILSLSTHALPLLEVLLLEYSLLLFQQGDVPIALPEDGLQLLHPVYVYLFIYYGTAAKISRLNNKCKSTPLQESLINSSENAIVLIPFKI